MQEGGRAERQEAANAGDKQEDVPSVSVKYEEGTGDRGGGEARAQVVVGGKASRSPSPRVLLDPPSVKDLQIKARPLFLHHVCVCEVCQICGWNSVAMLGANSRSSSVLACAYTLAQRACVCG